MKVNHDYDETLLFDECLSTAALLTNAVEETAQAIQKGFSQYKRNVW